MKWDSGFTIGIAFSIIAYAVIATIMNEGNQSIDTNKNMEVKISSTHGNHVCDCQIIHRNDSMFYVDRKGKTRLIIID